MLIEDADGKFWRIQVKTGWVVEEEGVILFATASSQNYTVKAKGWRSYKGQIDYFCVYVEQLSRVYMVPVDGVGASKSTLRLSPTRNNQTKGIRWAADYELRWAARESNSEPIGCTRAQMLHPRMVYAIHNRGYQEAGEKEVGCQGVEP